MDIKTRLRQIWADRPRGSHTDWDKREKAYEEYAETIETFFSEFDEMEFDPEDPAHCTVKNWQAVWNAAKAEGQKPSVETFALAPGDATKHINHATWMVCWEAGPRNWGVYGKRSITSWDGQTWEFYTPTGMFFETYWGFDILLAQ